MNPDFWSLTYIPSATTKSFRDWGISAANAEFYSAATDSMTIRVSNINADEDGPFAIDQKCWIKRNGIGYFFGRVVKISRMFDGAAESIEYALAGPGWYLDNLPFQQTWKIATDPFDEESPLEDSLRSRVLMFQDLSGIRISTIDMIHEVLNYVVL